MDQLMALMGPARSSLTREEVERRAAQSRRPLFDKMCKARRLTPTQLAKLPSADLARLARDVCGVKRVDDSVIVQWAKEYAEGKD